MRLYTIGFAEKPAEKFFSLLHEHRVDTLVDIRLRPDSQLSGFAKQRDLPYFLHNLITVDYQHQLLMAPTDDLLNQYRKDKSWDAYEVGFKQLLEDRNLISQLDRAWWASHSACLLCSEHDYQHCHRRLVAEYLASHWSELEISHLK
jgi:uncharacterized protein (DUF488 family)